MVIITKVPQFYNFNLIQVLNISKRQFWENEKMWNSYTRVKSILKDTRKISLILKGLSVKMPSKDVCARGEHGRWRQLDTTGSDIASSSGASNIPKYHNIHTAKLTCTVNCTGTLRGEGGFSGISYNIGKNV